MADEKSLLERVKKELNKPTDLKYTGVLSRRKKANSKGKCIQGKPLIYRGKRAHNIKCTRNARTTRMMGRVEVPLCQQDAALWDRLVDWAKEDFYLERFPSGGEV